MLKLSMVMKMVKAKIETEDEKKEIENSSVKIPQENLAKLENWAFKLGKSKTEMKKKYIEIFTTLKGKFGKLSEHELHKNAIKLLRSQLSKVYGSLSAKATAFYGYIIGDSGMWNEVERLKEIAKAIYEKDRERAIMEGFTTNEGIPLDFRKKLRWGDNPKFGQILEGEEWRRDLVGVCHVGDFRWKPFILHLRDEQVNQSIPMDRYVMFRANGKETDSGYYRLFGSSATIFVTEHEPEGQSLLKILREIDTVPIDELEEIATSNRFNLVAIRGEVVALFTNVDGFRLILMDEDGDPDSPTISILSDEAYPEGSLIFAIGRARLFESNGETRLYFDCYGFKLLERGLDIDIKEPLITIE